MASFVGNLAGSISVVACTRHGDDDLASGISMSDVADRLRSRAEWIRSVDDRCDASGFQEFVQQHQILMSGHGGEG